MSDNKTKRKTRSIQDYISQSMSNKQAHLEMIQSIVSRLSQNSFLLKGWSIVLVSALLALAAKDSYPRLIYVSYFPVIAFWLLDGYFLWQERIFRQLYDSVRIVPEDKIDFSMDCRNLPHPPSRLSGLFSKTLIIFHGILILSVSTLTYFMEQRCYAQSVF